MEYQMKYQMKYLIYMIMLVVFVSVVSAERTTKMNEDMPILTPSLQIASILEEGDMTHCYYADESYAVYHNGLWWAWLAPIAQSDWGLVPDASLIGDGWRNVASEEEWALKPDASAFISTGKCAATYFFPITPWCDWNDPATYYIDGTLSEFWVVHDDCEDNSTTVTCYIDTDMDGYGSTSTVEAIDGTCDTSQGESYNSYDCDDTDASINPMATESCDGIDNNCDGAIDEGVTMRYYEDFDGDSFGNPSSYTDACDIPKEYVTDNTDCDDSNSGINPAAPEICNGRDENCNILVDDDIEVPIQACTAGIGACMTAGVQTKICEGTNGWSEFGECSAIPGEPSMEICNGLDDDCNGLVDDEVDADIDGLYECGSIEDKCAGTIADPWTEKELWPLRYKWDGEWLKKMPRKGLVDANIDMQYTYGCSCVQILDKIYDETGRRLNRAYAHGCGPLLMLAWHRNAYRFYNDE